MLAVNIARSGLGLQRASTHVLGRCALTSRKRTAKRTRRLPVSSSSVAISRRTAPGVSNVSSGVSSHSMLARSRERNVSTWRHLTRSSSMLSQYPVAQVGQLQFLPLAGLLNHPCARRQWQADPGSSGHDCWVAWQCAHETEMPSCWITDMKTMSRSCRMKVVSSVWDSCAMYGQPHHWVSWGNAALSQNRERKR